MKASIGLFGGTFDPVHCGHVGIAKAFVESDLINELWVLLTPDPPHKKEKIHAPFGHRAKMLEAAFDNYPSIEISTVENTLPRPTYTIQTVQFLSKNNPAYRYYLCVGEDSLTHFTDWYRYEDILKLCDLIVARRPGFNSQDVPRQILDHVNFVEHEPMDISSSKIRSLLQNNESAENYVPQPVLDIIRKHNLYASNENN